MAEPYWINRLARLDETDAIMELVRAIHGDAHPELNRAYFEWRYRSGTGFRAEVVMAEFEGKPIAILPMSIFDFQWQDRFLTGVMITGLLTHPDHRRRGIFRLLTESVRQLTAERNGVFVMGMPNEASLPGYLKFGGWAYPGLIPMYARVIDGPAALRPKLGRIGASLVGWAPELLFRRRSALSGMAPVDAERVERVPGELDEVCDEFARECGTLMIRRTAAYWDWRYRAKPDSNYRTMIVREGGRLLGAVVTAIQPRAGMDVGMIIDMAARGGVSSMRQLLQAAEDNFRECGIGIITCQATTPLLHDALAQEGYRRLKDRWLPKKFHYVYRPTGVPGLIKEPSELSDWHLTFGDSDNT